MTEVGGPASPRISELDVRIIPLASGPAARRGDSARGPNSGHRANTVLAICLFLVLAIAPVPIASNRPDYWLIWGIVVGLIGLVYIGLLLILRADLRVGIGRFWLETLLVLAWIAAIVAQTLPVSALLMSLGVDASSVTLLDGIRVQFPTPSIDPGPSVFSLLLLFTYAVFTFLFMQVAVNRKRAQVLVGCLFALVVGNAIYALINLTQWGDTLLGMQKVAYQGFATGTFVNRNSFATFLAAGLAMGMPLLVDNFAEYRRSTITTRLVRSLVVMCGMAFILAALFATGSRMGIGVGAFASLATLLMMLLLGGARSRWAVVLVLAAVLVAVVGVVAALYGNAALERLIFVRDDFGRYELYRQVWDLILERPWTGYGAGTFETTFPAFQNLPLSIDYAFDKAHSTYLLAWYEMGFVAGSIPMLIVLSIVVRALRSLALPENRMVAITSIGVTTVFALHSTVDFSLEIEANALLFCAALALGGAATLQGKSLPVRGASKFDHDSQANNRRRSGR